MAGKDSRPATHQSSSAYAEWGMAYNASDAALSTVRPVACKLHVLAAQATKQVHTKFTTQVRGHLFILAPAAFMSALCMNACMMHFFSTLTADCIMAETSCDMLL